jgi:hypothetical protein
MADGRRTSAARGASLGRTFLALVMLGAVTRPAGAAGPFGKDPDLPRFESVYYSMQSELDPAVTRDIMLRMDWQVVEFGRQFKGFGGNMRAKLKFRAYATYAGTATIGASPMPGFYQGSRIRVIACMAEGFTQMMHSARHVSFPQFSFEVACGYKQIMPVWADLGLADYFAYGAFNGQGYTLGIVPLKLMENVQNSIQAGTCRPLAELFAMTRPDFYRATTAKDFAQVWSVAHYLAESDRVRLRPAFERYLSQVAGGAAEPEAFKAAFGDVATVEAGWKKYWLAQTPETSRASYANAAAQALVSYVGRTPPAKRNYKTAGDVLRAMPTFAADDALWLPPTMNDELTKLFEHAGSGVKVEFVTDPLKPRVVVKLPSGRAFDAAYVSPVREDGRRLVETVGPAMEVVAGFRQPTTPAADARPAAAGSGFVVKSARFGVDGQWADVTEQCKKLITEDYFTASRNFAVVFGVDPAPDRQKVLDLTLGINGAEVRLQLGDNREVLPLQMTTRIPDEPPAAQTPEKGGRP